MQTGDVSVLSKIRVLAETALQQAGTPDAVIDALRQIAALAEPQRGDTPEPSDLPRTENQTL